jgi:hypothetical protein
MRRRASRRIANRMADPATSTNLIDKTAGHKMRSDAWQIDRDNRTVSL